MAIGFQQSGQSRGLVGILLAVLSSFLVLTGCNLDRFRVEAAQVPEITTSFLGDPQTFNFALSSTSPNVFGLIYEGLITSNGITGEIEPALAESWEISDDNRQITFRLRPGLRWSDGHPLTVDDVVFTYQDIYLNEAIPAGARDILRVGVTGALPTVEKIDDRRIIFRVPEPFAPFLRNTGLPILPRHILAKSVHTLDSEGKPLFLSQWGVGTPPQEIVTNGMYTIASYVTSQRIVLQRNPYYWRRSPTGEQQPYVERFIWKIVENRDTQLLKFRSGDLDVSEPLRPEDFPLLKREEKRGNFRVEMGGPRPGTVFITFNLNRGSRNGKPLVDPIKSRWFNTLAFRQAVAYAIDRQKMVENIFRGLGATINSPLPSQTPYYLPPEAGLPVYNYDPDKAKRLLLAAGFTYNDRAQLLDADGNRVRFTLLTNAENTVRVSMAAQIKQDLAKIGIQVDFTPIAFSALVDKLGNSLDWECHLLGFTGGIEPHAGFNIWSPDGSLHSFNQKPLPNQPPIEGRQVADWEQAIGDLYIQGAQVLDEAKRREIYGKTQILAQENLPFIYLATELLMSAVRNTIQGVQFSDLEGALWNLYEIQVTL
ncbi:ABC transporter substrate-binding protein [Trichothermofontia sp.]